MDKRWVDPERQRWIWRHAQSFVPSQRFAENFVRHVSQIHWLDRTTNPNFERDLALAAELFSHSSLHNRLDYPKLLKAIAYPIAMNQYSLIGDSFMSVGFFNAETEKLWFRSNTIVTDPMILRSGNRGWVVDSVSTNGRVRDVVAGITLWCQRNRVPETHLDFIRCYPNGEERVNRWSLRYRKKYADRMRSIENP